MTSGIRVVVDETERGLTIRWSEDGLERHVWVDQQTFEQFLAAGKTVYVDTPAVAVQSSKRLETSQGT
jgi:RNase P/RNase MRP subunit p29